MSTYYINYILVKYYFQTNYQFNECKKIKEQVIQVVLSKNIF